MRRRSLFANPSWVQQCPLYVYIRIRMPNSTRTETLQTFWLSVWNKSATGLHLYTLKKQLTNLYDADIVFCVVFCVTAVPQAEQVTT